MKDQSLRQVVQPAFGGLKNTSWGTRRGLIRLRRTHRKSRSTQNGTHSAGVWSVSFSPDGKRIVSGSGDRTLKVWDARPLDTSK